MDLKPQALAQRAIVRTRPIDHAAEARLLAAGVAPLLARLYAARGVQSRAQIDAGLERLLHPSGLTQSETAAARLADAIDRQEHILVIADYDCDGATACAVAVRGLRALGAQIDYLVPNRFETGYGLTPEIVDIAKARFAPHLIVTVDNGIASVQGAQRAAQHGIDLIITDHHLPARTLPSAQAIVNPNQPGCAFASKHLAGVGVIFYVLLALRAELRKRGHFAKQREPRLDQLLDLVALGTVADVVPLDGNNRILVSEGLKRMRAGRMHAGIAALFRVAGREARSASAADLGFAIGPRINAAGRLADMALGIACLLEDDSERAAQLAERLSAINQERRQIEAGMESAALASLAALDQRALHAQQHVICVADAAWHQGVVGILAGRLKERFHRPSIAFAPVDANRWRGSGRSIEGLHLRDVLDLVIKREPELILQFGGHAMAAGLTIPTAALARFPEAFERAVADRLEPSARQRVLEVDGSLIGVELSVALVASLEQAVWGQGFAAPQFYDRFTVLAHRLIKARHTKLRLRRSDGAEFDALWFNQITPLPSEIDLVYRLSTDHYQGQTRLQLTIAHQLSA